MEANWTDPFLFFIYSVAKPLSAALILVVMLDIISGGADPAYRAFVVVGTALWAIVLAGHLRAGLVGPRRPRALPDAQVRLRQPERLPGRPARPRRRAAGASGRWAGSSPSRVGILLLGVPFDPAAIDWPLLARRRWSSGLGAIIAIGVLLAAICLQTRQESWSYPEALAGALFLVSGVVFPLAVLPDAVQALGLVNAAGLVDRGRPPRRLPGRPVVDRRTGQPVAGLDRHRRPRTPPRSSSPCWRPGAGYTRRHRGLPGERAPRQGSRAAGPDHRLLMEVQSACGSTRAARARTSRKSSGPSARSSTSAG